jgi:hypothetical protein
VREQEEEEKGRGEGETKGEQDVGVGEAEVAASGEEGLRVAAQEGVEGAGDEGEGRVEGARQQGDAVHGQVVGERRDEAPADQFRRWTWRAPRGEGRRRPVSRATGSGVVPRNMGNQFGPCSMWPIKSISAILRPAGWPKSRGRQPRGIRWWRRRGNGSTARTGSFGGEAGWRRPMRCGRNRRVVTPNRGGTRHACGHTR